MDPNGILKRHQRLKSQRASTVESTWRECFDLTFPLRGSGLAGAVRTADSAMADQARIHDSTAADAANTLAANIMAGLTPANARWFALDVGNETDEERRWLDESADLLWENIHNSNFDAEGFEACLDIVLAGQFALFIDEDRERGGLNFQQWPLAQCWFASTRSDGRIDTVHREYPLTADQAAQEFGLENLPEAMQRAIRDGKGDDEFQFLHVIEPRTPHAVGAKMARNLPVASVHIAVESKKVLRESGFHEFPVAVPRWLKVAGSLYAVGPLYAALPDIRQLNELKAMELMSADIAVGGMWLGIDDGVLNPRTVKLGPRKIIIAADKDSLTPLETGADFQLSDVMVAKLQASIRKVLMADQLQPQDGPDMTATEVHVRVEMIRKLMGPTHGRLQAEYLKTLVERTFGLAFRAGVFKPAPQSLRDREFSVRYVSPMARAQRLDEVMAIETVFMSAGAMAQFDPTVMDHLDNEKAIELIVEGRGAPQSIRRDPKDVAKLRADRAKAAEAAQAREGAMNAQAVGMEEAAKRAATA